MSGLRPRVVHRNALRSHPLATPSHRNALRSPPVATPVAPQCVALSPGRDPHRTAMRCALPQSRPPSHRNALRSPPVATPVAPQCVALSPGRDPLRGPVFDSESVMEGVMNVASREARAGQRPESDPEARKAVLWSQFPADASKVARASMHGPIRGNRAVRMRGGQPSIRSMASATPPPVFAVFVRRSVACFATSSGLLPIAKLRPAH